MNESTLMGASKFVSIVIATFALVTGGMWVANQPADKMPGKGSSPAHWMFWLVGRDLDEELLSPKPVFDPGQFVAPTWDLQEGEFARYMREEQEKRDRLMEEIRAQWGPH